MKKACKASIYVCTHVRTNYGNYEIGTVTSIEHLK